MRAELRPSKSGRGHYLVLHDPSARIHTDTFDDVKGHRRHMRVARVNLREAMEAVKPLFEEWHTERRPGVIVATGEELPLDWNQWDTLRTKKYGGFEE